MTDDESPGLGLDLPEIAPKPAESTPYRVLARKYRPQSFAELIGQDAMVTTLGNAIARDRIAHAFLLTGVRGVGKTSTARLAAREATGQNWHVRLAEEGGEPSLQQQEAMAEERARAAILDEPPVRAILEQYPEAILETVTRKEA